MENSERNISIFRDHAQGMKPGKLSEKYGISSERIRQIVGQIERHLKYIEANKHSPGAHELYLQIFNEYLGKINEIQSATRKTISKNNQTIRNLVKELKQKLNNLRWRRYDPDENPPPMGSEEKS